jgi:hypothetical protein
MGISDILWNDNDTMKGKPSNIEDSMDLCENLEPQSISCRFSLGVILNVN